MEVPELCWALLCGDNGSKQAHAGFLVEEASPLVREEEIKKVYVCVFCQCPLSLGQGELSLCVQRCYLLQNLLLTCFVGYQGRVLDGSHNRKATHTQTFAC